jgi:hypothetical protein
MDFHSSAPLRRERQIETNGMADTAPTGIVDRIGNPCAKVKDRGQEVEKDNCSLFLNNLHAAWATSNWVRKTQVLPESIKSGL